MNKEAHDAVRKVLKEAGEHEHFFDFSDAERLTWMIERAYALGRQKGGEPNTFGQRNNVRRDATNCGQPGHKKPS